MSAIGEVNPYDFAYAPNEEAPVRAPGREDFEIVATGPLSFDDYRHAIRLGAWPFVIIVLCLSSLVIGYFAINATQDVLIDIGARGFVLVLFVVFSIPMARRRDLRLFEKIRPIRRWVITDTGFHQEEYDGESVFVPYSSVVRATCSKRVVVILPKTSLHTDVKLIVPRAAFTEDLEWQRFVQNLQNAGNANRVEAPESAKLAGDVDAADPTGVVATGPMNQVEAAAFLNAIPQRHGFRNLFLFLLLAVLVLSGPVMFLKAGADMATVLLMFLPLAACFMLMVLGVAIGHKMVRQAPFGFSRWVLTRDGVEITRDGVTVTAKWDSVKSKRIIPEGILLFGEEPVAYLVPRSGFKSEHDWNAARRLVGNIREAAEGK